MPTLFITEYSQLLPTGGALGQMPQEAPIAEQTVAIGGSSVQSATFQSATQFVRLTTDAICSIKFGPNPTATTTTQRMAANQTEYHGVPLNGSFKVAVISNT